MPKHLFQKGQSGNPGGRPKAIHRVEDLARTKTELAIKTLAEIAGNAKSSDASRVAASVALLERAWGKPMAHVDMKASIRRDPRELTDADLAAIAAGSSPAADEASENPEGQLH